MADRWGARGARLSLLSCALGVAGIGAMLVIVALREVSFSRGLVLIALLTGVGLAGVGAAPWVRRSGEWRIAALLSWSSASLLLGAVAITLPSAVALLMLPAAPLAVAGAMCLSRPPGSAPGFSP
jgi:hypothetical protein